MADSNHYQSNSTNLDVSSIIPVGAVHTDQLEKFLNHQEAEYLFKGQDLFNIGDEDDTTIYLLSGEIELIDREGMSEKIVAGSRESWRPIAHHQPRLVTARASCDISFIRVDSYRYDTLLAWDQAAGYMVLDISSNRGLDEDADWMIKLLHNEVFHQIPPANIINIFNNFEEVAVKEDDYIFRQGETGDSCYYIKSGEFSVLVGSGEDENQVATLCAGSSFGEDSLLSDKPRNASIRALSDGFLMRLDKSHFEELLKAPVVSEIDMETALKKIESGAIWIDTRLDEEFNSGHLENSIHIPLHLLRLKMRLLDKKVPYIVYCDTGRRSAAATYLLSQAGYEVYLLQGGCPARSLGNH